MCECFVNKRINSHCGVFKNQFNMSMEITFRRTYKRFIYSQVPEGGMAGHTGPHKLSPAGGDWERVRNDEKVPLLGSGWSPQAKGVMEFYK